MIKQPYLVSAAYMLHGTHEGKAFILRVDNQVEIYGHIVQLLEKTAQGYTELKITASELTEEKLRKLVKECYDS